MAREDEANFLLMQEARLQLAEAAAGGEGDSNSTAPSSTTRSNASAKGNNSKSGRGRKGAAAAAALAAAAPPTAKKAFSEYDDDYDDQCVFFRLTPKHNICACVCFFFRACALVAYNFDSLFMSFNIMRLAPVSQKNIFISHL